MNNKVEEQMNDNIQLLAVIKRVFHLNEALSANGEQYFEKW